MASSLDYLVCFPHDLRLCATCLKGQCHGYFDLCFVVNPLVDQKYFFEFFSESSREGIFI
jgi:hypothetical protein